MATWPLRDITRIGGYRVVPAIGVVAATWRTVLGLMDGDQAAELGSVPAPGFPADPADAPSASVVGP